jgi:hypothetical protein
MITSPIGTVANFGYYTQQDLRNHMIFLGDITSHRLGRMISVAEEEFQGGRNVLFLTESPGAEFLRNIGFLYFRPDEEVTEDEIENVVENLVRDNNDPHVGIVFDTRRIADMGTKNRITRWLMTALSRVRFFETEIEVEGKKEKLNIEVEFLQNLSIIFENTEALFARQWNRGNRSGVDILNVLLKRAKSEGCTMVFGAESNKEIAQEIANNCGMAIVSRNTSRRRALDVAGFVYPKMANHLETAYGLLAMPEDRFFGYNWAARFTPEARALMDVGGLDVEYTNLDIPPFPIALRATSLMCGFDPNDPHKYRLPEGLDQTAQESFDEMLESIRESNKESHEEEMSIRSSRRRKVSAKAKSGRGVRKLTSLRNNSLNDNDAQGNAASNGAGFDLEDAIKLAKENDITSARSVITIAVKVLSAHHKKLNMPVSERLTAIGVVKEVLKNKQLSDAIAWGRSFSRKHSNKEGQKISAAALASVYLRAMRQNNVFSEDFHKKIDVNILLQLCAGNDEKRSSEAQYNYLSGLLQNSKFTRAPQKKRLPKAA